MDVGQILAGLILARAGGIVLLWISRPAAQVELPPLTSRRAVVEVAVGAVAAVFVPIFLVTTLATVRVVMALSYRAWGGIRPSSLAWVRGVAAAAVLFIGYLPKWSPSLFAR